MVLGYLFLKLQSAFETKLLERIPYIRIGDPLKLDTNFGPLASFPHMQKVLDFIERSKQQGARVLTGASAYCK